MKETNAPEEDDAFYEIVSEIENSEVNEESDLPALYAQQTAAQEISGAKRNRILANIVATIVSLVSILIVRAEIFSYDPETGAYEKALDHATFIEKHLANDTSHQLGTKEIREIEARILRMPDLQAQGDDFNNNPTLVNCLNGVVDISGDVPRLLPHSSDYRFTYCIQANFLDTKACWEPAVFNAFCKTSLDGDLQKRLFLLERTGYCCSDSTAGKCAFFDKGEPNSGKSIIGDFTTYLIGRGNVSNIQINHLNSRFSAAQFYNKKLNFAGEMKATALPDISVFKMLTGGDRIMGEFKGKDAFYFLPRCKHLFSGNVMPTVAEADATAAFSNRVKVLLFNHSIPPEEQDKGLKDKLIAESNPIFTLAMYALVELRKRNFQFTIPKDSAAFVEHSATSQNSVVQFVHECCILKEEYRAHNRDIFAAYAEFCKKNALNKLPRDTLFSVIDAQPGVVSSRFRLNEENLHGRIGIALMPTCGTLEQSRGNNSAATDTGVPEKRNMPGYGGTDNEKM